MSSVISNMPKCVWTNKIRVDDIAQIENVLT